MKCRLTSFHIVVAIGFLTSSVPSLCAEIKLSDRAELVFASAEEGKTVLTAPDEYVRGMSPFDRASRMESEAEVTEEQYLDFVGGHVLAWTEEEKARAVAALEGVLPALREMNLPFPQKVQLVKTTGREEGGAAYTRGTAVVLPQRMVDGSDLSRLISHELFHVLTRANPELRDRLYAAIGFVKIDEIEFPKELKPRKLSNPDALTNAHCILVHVDEKPVWVMPVIFSRSERFDAKRGGPFFKYLQFGFLVLERTEGSSRAAVVYDAERPKIISPRQMKGFFEQVGENTGYIIHPEEILGDNFALLFQKEAEVRSPEVLKKIRDILRTASAQKPVSDTPKP